MKLISNIKTKIWIFNVGSFGMLKYFNVKQRYCLIKSFIKGDLDKECEIIGGEINYDKTIYIIRHDYKKVGLFSIFNCVAGDIMYAIKNNYIPVVDLVNCRNAYLSKKQDSNPWDYFFLQPGGVSLKKALKAKKIILSPLKIKENRPNDSMNFFNNKNNTLKEWRELALDYLIPTKEILCEAKIRYKKLCNDKKVLAVSIRGTDYVLLEPPNHPIQPKIEKIIKDAEDMFLKGKYDLIFINTEDKKIAKTFKEYFDEKCVENERELVDYSEGFIMDQIRKQNDEARIISGKDYLITQLMMNMADGLLASRSSGVVGSFVMPNNWKEIKIYDLGRYPQKK